MSKKPLALKITFRNKKETSIENVIEFHSTNKDELIIHYVVSPYGSTLEKRLLWKNIKYVEVK